MKYCYLILVIVVIYLMYNYCNYIEPFVSTDYDTSKDRLIGGKYGSPDDDSMFSFSLGSNCPDNIGDSPVNDFKGNLTNCDYRKTDCFLVANKENKIDWPYGDKNDSKRKECQKCVRGSDKISGITSILANAYDVGFDKPENSDTSSYNRFTEFSGYICDSMVGCGDVENMYAFNQTNWGADCGKNSFDTTNTDTIINSMRCGIVDNFLVRTVGSYLGGVTCNLEIQGLKLVKGAKDMVMDVEDTLNPSKWIDKITDKLPF